MRESAFQAKLLKALRNHQALRDAVIWKLNDRTTRGIPDVLVSLKGVTTFFELKIFPNTLTKIQKYYMKKLEPRAYTVSAYKDGFVYVHPATKDWFPVSPSFTFLEAVEQIVRRCVDV